MGCPPVAVSRVGDGAAAGAMFIEMLPSLRDHEHGPMMVNNSE
jgi:hypothetical protein